MHLLAGMVRGSLRSRTFRRVFVKTPGNRVTLHYRRRKPNFPQCAGCGENLKGTVRAFPRVLQNLPKSAKRPERPYGGVLCSACSRKKIISIARSK